MKKNSLIPLILCLVPLTLGAAEVRQEFSRHTITVGDRVDFTLTVTLPAGTETKDLPGGMILQAFEIKDYDLGTWTEEGDIKTITQTFQLSTYTTGTYFTSPWRLVYREGEEEKTLDVPPFPLVVSSLLGEGDTEPRDIKEPYGIKKTGLPWWVYLAAGIILLAGLISFYFVRKRKKADAVDIPSVPPHVAALKALEELRLKALMSRGEEKEHYVRLTDIFKHYLEGRYRVDALEKTTTELWETMKNLPLERKDLMSLKEFMNVSDLTKFAKHHPDEERGESDIDLVKTVVETTREADDDPVP